MLPVDGHDVLCFTPAATATAAAAAAAASQSPGSGQLSSSPLSPSLEAYKTKHAEREVQW
jgi:hypothetical protein